MRTTIEHGRLQALRGEMARSNLDGFILSTGDEHFTEFPAPHSHRLRWLTGFTGSTASIAVTDAIAAIFVDGRYTVLARLQVSQDDWFVIDVPQISIEDWLVANAAGKRIGFDPRLTTRSVLAKIEQRDSSSTEFVPQRVSPIDAIWLDRPARPGSAAFIYPIERSGKSSADKRRELADWLVESGADASVLVALDSIAWLLNIRGRDLEIAPLVYSFAICYRDGKVDLFVDLPKIDAAVRAHLGKGVRVLPYDSFYAALRTMPGKVVSLDPALTPVAVYAELVKGGAIVLDETNPIGLSKAIKNDVEIEGMRQAHVRDGAALTRFLHWFSIEAPKGGLTELSAAAHLNKLRRETPNYHSLSFDPVSAVDANAALPHYQPLPATDTVIKANSIYLVDSGGQYIDGTTDVTRTVAVGMPALEVKDRFTRVLKGHIAMDTLAFPIGTLGSRLDAVARMSLWAGGIDCSHGIGHGVGHFLNVHEGPAYIAPFSRSNEAPLAAGMILSNEPGYYKLGHYGIRTENLMVVVERPVDGGDTPMLGFETLTLAPIDRRLIDIGMLTEREIDWLNRYHARVFDELGGSLSADERRWLKAETAPIGGTIASPAIK